MMTPAECMSSINALKIYYLVFGLIPQSKKLKMVNPDLLLGLDSCGKFIESPWNLVDTIASLKIFTPL